MQVLPLIERERDERDMRETEGREIQRDIFFSVYSGHQRGPITGRMYRICVNLVCQHLYHVNIFIMSTSLSCQCLYHVNICIMSTSLPCQHLYHVHIFIMSTSFSCQHLYHVNIILYHVNIFIISSSLS